MLWAKIDAGTGRIVSHGACADVDFDKQKVPTGQMIVQRPAYVTAREPWRCVEGQWNKEVHDGS